jgi:hypothetical protein
MVFALQMIITSENEERFKSGSECIEPTEHHTHTVKDLNLPLATLSDSSVSPSHGDV